MNINREGKRRTTRTDKRVVLMAGRIIGEERIPQGWVLKMGESDVLLS